jgi:nucleoside-triphosphatase
MDEYHKYRKGRGRLLLLTGLPGAGKTTVLRRVSERLAHRRAKGFYTEEMRSGGQREGFRLVTFDGQRSVIAHIGFRTGPRVGRYRVDVAAIDHAAGTALGPGADVYLVDEIGKMECLSSGFVGAIGALLEGTAPMVATVAKRGGGLIEEVKDPADVEVWEVTPANRGGLPERVLQWLSSR